jgi:colanic acid biosynthesis glycosyl transferase WcaI
VTSRSAPQTPFLRPRFPNAPGTPSGDRLVPAPSDPALARRCATPALQGRHVIVVGVDYAPGAGGQGGTAHYTTAIAEHLATSASAVTVLSGVPESAAGRVPSAYRRGLRTAEPGWLTDGPRVVRLRRYAAGRRRGPARHAVHEASFLLNAASAGRRLPADLVLGVTPGAGAAAAAAWLARRCGAPLVTLVQGAPAPDEHLAPALERYALRRSAHVTVASPAFTDRLVAAGVDPARLHLLPLWSRVEAPGTSRAAARAALGWDADRFVAVHAGPLGSQHDGATIVEAARYLAAEDPDGGAQLLFAGEGPPRASLEQQAFGLPGVRFLDAVDDATLPLVLAAADVLVAAEVPGTDAATTSGQLAAYLTAGRAVVAAVPAGGPTAGELRRAGGAGVRVDPGDPAALADALLDLAAAPERRAAMGRAGRRYARAHLSREASLRRLDAVVEAALDLSGERA